MAVVDYYILSRSLIQLHGRTSTLAKAIGSDRKGRLSILCYPLGAALAFIEPWFGFAAYALVIGIWIIPDKRIEKKLVEEEKLP